MKCMKLLMVASLACAINANAFRSAGIIGMRTWSKHHIVKMLDEIVPFAHFCLDSYEKRFCTKDVGYDDQQVKILRSFIPKVSVADIIEASDFEDATDKYHGGMLLDFAAGDDFKCGTHIFLTTTPGIDAYMSYRHRQIQLGVGFGFGLLTKAISIKTSTTPIVLPCLEGFVLIKGDYFINLSDQEPDNNLILSIGYKRSAYPLIGYGESVFIGISKTF